MSIKYIKPVYSKTQSGKSLDDRTDFARIYEDVDGTFNDINDENARRAIYETTADRINQELASVLPSIAAASGSDTATATATFTFQDTDTVRGYIDAAAAGTGTGSDKNLDDTTVASLKENLKKWGANGEHYIDGYGVIYGKDEKDVIAVQDKRTKNWFIAHNNHRGHQIFICQDHI